MKNPAKTPRLGGILITLAVLGGALFSSLHLPPPALTSKTFHLECRWEQEPSSTWYTTNLETWIPPKGIGYKFHIGFRYNPRPTISVRCPVKVGLVYDELKAAPGGVLPLTMTVQTEALTKVDEYNFASHFGLEIPWDLCLGLAMDTDDGTIGTDWYPISMWTILGFIPDLGDVLSLLGELNVSIEERGALPLGGESVTYKDEKTIFELTPAFLGENLKKHLSKDFFKLVGGYISSGKSGAAQKLVKAVTAILDDPEKLKFAQELLGDVAWKFSSLMKFFQIIGEATYTLEGFKIIVYVKSQVGDQMANTHVFEFERPNVSQRRDILVPPFVGYADKIDFWIEKVEYEMRISAGLGYSARVIWQTIVDVPPEKNVQFYGRAAAESAAEETRFSVPLQPPPALYDVHVRMGARSAVLHWITGKTQAKSQVKVEDSAGNLLRTITNDDFRFDHTVVIPGLTPSTTYTFRVSSDPGGAPLVAPPLQGTTLSVEAIPKRGDSGTNDLRIGHANETREQWVKVTGLTTTSVTLEWATNRLSSTEVFYSASPDYVVAYVANAKVRTPSGGEEVQSGYISGTPVLENNHVITLNGLQPATTYYFSAVSWSYEDGDPNKNPQDRAEVADLSFTTLPLDHPLLRVRVVEAETGAVINGAFVHLCRGENVFGQYKSSVQWEGQSGWTPAIPLDRGTAYRLEGRFEGFYDSVVDYGPPADLPGGVDRKTIALSRRKPMKGVVTDAFTQEPVPDCTVIIGKSWTELSRTKTDGLGEYVFQDLGAGEWYELRFEKTRYKTKTTRSQASPDGVFSGGTCVLTPDKVVLEISIQDEEGHPLPAKIEFLHYGQFLEIGPEGNGRFDLFWFGGGKTVALLATPAGSEAALYKSTSRSILLENGHQYRVDFRLEEKDLTPPQILDLHLERSSENSYALAWRTDEPAQGEVSIFHQGTIKGSETGFYTGLEKPHSFPVPAEYLKGSPSSQYILKALDFSGNLTNVGPTPFGLLTNEPPVILALDDRRLSTTEWEIRWKTSKTASGKVDFFKPGENDVLTTLYLPQNFDQTAVFNLARILGLQLLGVDQTYEYIVSATDFYGNTATSGRRPLPSSLGAQPFEIAAAARGEGMIAPEGAVKVQPGGGIVFGISPKNASDRLIDVVVDGKSVGPVDRYPFSDVRADHTIEAVFTAQPGDVEKESNAGPFQANSWNIELPMYGTFQSRMDGDHFVFQVPQTGIYTFLLDQVPAKIPASLMFFKDPYSDEKHTWWLQGKAGESVSLTIDMNQGEKFWVRVKAHSGLAPGEVYRLQKQSFLADPGEPNDTKGRATPLDVSSGETEIQGFFCDLASGDRDFYAFTLPKSGGNADVLAELMDVPSEIEPALSFFRGRETPERALVQGNPGESVRITFEAKAGETYYLCVRQRNYGRKVSSQPYRLTVTITPRSTERPTSRFSRSSPGG